MKRICKFTWREWSHLKPEQQARWRQYIADMNMELGIFCDEDDARLQNEFQKDHDEFVEEMSLGGRPYKEPGR